MDNLNYDVPGIIIDNYDWVENLSVEFAMESQRRFCMDDGQICDGLHRPRQW